MCACVYLLCLFTRHEVECYACNPILSEQVDEGTQARNGHKAWLSDASQMFQTFPRSLDCASLVTGATRASHFRKLFSRSRGTNAYTGGLICKWLMFMQLRQFDSVSKDMANTLRSITERAQERKARVSRQDVRVAGNIACGLQSWDQVLASQQSTICSFLDSRTPKLE